MLQVSTKQRHPDHPSHNALFSPNDVIFPFSICILIHMVRNLSAYVVPQRAEEIHGIHRTAEDLLHLRNRVCAHWEHHCLAQQLYPFGRESSHNQVSIAHPKSHLCQMVHNQCQANHQGHLFQWLPSGKCLHSCIARTEQMRKRKEC